MPRVYETPTADAIAALLSAEGPLTSREISEALGLQKRGVNEAIARDRRKQARIRIAAWDVSKAPHKPIYSVGRRPDAVKPPPKGNALCKREQRARHRAIINARARNAKHGTTPNWLTGLAP